MIQNFLTNSVAEKQKLDLCQFRALTLPMMDRIYNTPLRLTENWLAAEDLLPDTYLRAWRYFAILSRKLSSRPGFIASLQTILSTITEKSAGRRQGIGLERKRIIAMF